MLLESINAPLTAIILTESWYTDTSQAFCPPLYQYFYRNREDKCGGGMASLVKEGIIRGTVGEVYISNPNIEVLALRSRDDFFRIIYRPPTGDFNRFRSFTARLFVHVVEGNFTLFLGGDCDVDMLVRTIGKNFRT